MAAKWPHLLHLPSPNGRLVALIATVRAGPVWPTLRGIQLIFEELLTFTQQLNEEEQRVVRQGPSGEELAVFDLLTKPAPGLAVREESNVRKGGHDLFDTLKREKLVLDWRKCQQTRADVLLTIEHVLDDGLLRLYPRRLPAAMCHRLRARLRFVPRMRRCLFRWVLAQTNGSKDEYRGA